MTNSKRRQKGLNQDHLITFQLTPAVSKPYQPYAYNDGSTPPASTPFIFIQSIITCWIIMHFISVRVLKSFFFFFFSFFH
jgi:hypothetical protein